ncbi:MAG: ParB/RepB/Spo0J family partition protein [Chloroflexota bacterium]|nr:ParB/RepB/Spo0J family partition protein [Chloroflexota bacterium]
MVKSHGLGRGLDALIPPVGSAGSVELPIERVARNPRQPRRRFDDESLAELTESIKAHGVLQPILVRPVADAYQVIAGERRLRAARNAGLTKIPALVRDASGSDQLEIALIENLQRADLNPVEEAEAYRELVDRFGLSQEMVAQRVGKSRVAVTNALRLLELAPEVRDAIAMGRISEGHGRALVSLGSTALQRELLMTIVRRQLSVRQTEELVRRRRSRGDGKVAVRISDDLAALEDSLRKLLATRVSVARSRKGGRVVIEFYSDEELDRVYSVIERGAREHEPAGGGG